MIQAIHLFNDKQTKKNNEWMMWISLNSILVTLNLCIDDDDDDDQRKKNIVSDLLFTHTLRRHTHTGSNLF